MQGAFRIRGKTKGVDAENKKQIRTKRKGEGDEVAQPKKQSKRNSTITEETK